MAAMPRSTPLLILACVLLGGCAAVAAELQGKSTARQLLQGNTGGRGGSPGSTPGRTFNSVANHKQPEAPRLTRKSFDRAMPGKHLLADELAAGVESTSSRQLLQGNTGGRGGSPGSTPGRTFNSVANHKQPEAPRLTRKSFDRAMPGKHLLATVETVVETFAGRQLLQGNTGGRGGSPGSTPGRTFNSVANHKQPEVPRLTRKSFDRAMPGKHLLTEIESGSCCKTGGKGGSPGSTPGRTFNSVANHKQPEAPRLTRKSFERAMPGKHLLAAVESVVETFAGRQLLQGNTGGRGGSPGSTPGRTFNSVANHKQPEAPRLTRKSFQRKMP